MTTASEKYLSIYTASNIDRSQINDVSSSFLKG